MKDRVLRQWCWLKQRVMAGYRQCRVMISQSRLWTIASGLLCLLLIGFFFVKLGSTPATRAETLPTAAMSTPSDPMLLAMDSISARLERLMATLSRLVDRAHDPMTLQAHDSKIQQTLHGIETALQDCQRPGAVLTQALPAPLVVPNESGTLPFAVMGIEYWNARAFVRVLDAQRALETLLALGEKQGEWTLIALAAHQITFQHRNQETITLYLPVPQGLNA